MNNELFSTPMQIVLFLSSILSIAFSDLKSLTFEDFKRKDTFLIYAYYDKPGQECPACKDFNSKMASVESLPIKSVNFYDNPYLGSHLLEFVFPSFIIRDKEKSYILNISSFNDLLNLLDTGDWREKEPKKWYLDVNSPFIKIFAVLAFIFFFTMDRWASVIDNTPPFLITCIVCFIIAYLIVSIIGIFRDDLEKVKKD